MLKLKNVSTFYGNIQALKDVSMEILAGEIITLIGANGAGKSTTLMSISGVVPPRSGEVYFINTPIHNMSANKIVSLGISQVPEGRRIFPYLTVLENMDMGAFLRTDMDGIKEDMEYIFDLFPILAERRQQAGGTLSGGEQQMLAIARGLMSSPKLMLLDEPSLGLAPLMVEEIFRIIEEINKEGVTILLVEQNANMALQTAQYGYVMETGTVALHDKAENLIQNDYVRRVYLGAGD
jgi:branched-chain amino acid transport system ATP-binding protein